MVAALDVATLLLVLLGGVYLGLLGLVGFDFIQWFNPGLKTPVYDIIGVSAVWQLSRQRF